MRASRGGMTVIHVCAVKEIPLLTFNLLSICLDSALMFDLVFDEFVVMYSTADWTMKALINRPIDQSLSVYNNTAVVLGEIVCARALVADAAMFAYSSPHNHQLFSFSWNMLIWENHVFSIFVGTGYLLLSANYKSASVANLCDHVIKLLGLKLDRLSNTRYCR